MYTKTVVVTLVHGLHIRPCANFVKAAKGFSSEIMVSCAEKQAPALSLFQLQGLGITQGASVTLTATGQDELEAVEHLAALLTEQGS